MKDSNTNKEHSPPSVLASLRGLIPNRQLTVDEALRIAEHQAIRLLKLTEVDEAPVSGEIILSLPRIKLRHHQLSAASGMTYWDGEHWIIGINSTEPMTRQRFTLLHEYKHIVDHGRTSRLYSGDRYRTAEHQAELAADYFAGCALMPKLLLKAAWFGGMQDLHQLAQHFDVSVRAIEVRLTQLGLRDADTPSSSAASRRLPLRRRRYYRLPHVASRPVAELSGVPHA